MKLAIKYLFRLLKDYFLCQTQEREIITLHLKFMSSNIFTLGKKFVSNSIILDGLLAKYSTKLPWI